MNNINNQSNKGQTTVFGFALLAIAFIFIITSFATIEPIKETLDNARNTTALNCQGTDNFNQTAFDNDENNTVVKLTRRTTCAATGFTMVYFVGAFLIAMVVWVVRNWRKL